MKGRDGGNPGGIVPPKTLGGWVGVLVAAGTAGSIPAARSLSSKELGSAAGVDTDAGTGVEGAGWKGTCKGSESFG